VDLALKNLIYGPNVARAIAGGYNAQGVATPGGAYSRVIVGFDEASTQWAIQPALDPLARDAAVDPASLTHVLGTGRGTLSAGLKTWDAKLTGTPYTLPGGDLGVAVGASYMRESLEGSPEENIKTTVRRWLGASYFDLFERNRDVKAAFAEVRIPVTGGNASLPGLHALDLTAAYRWEDYSDAGESKVPKVGVRWQPIDEQLTLRYTYSEAFTAPALHYLFGPQLEGFVSSQSMRTVFGSGYDAAQFRSGSNPNLRPSTAKTHSTGFVLSPKAVKGLTVTVDYVEAKQVDVIGSIGTATVMQSVEQLGPQSPYVSQVTLEAFPGSPGAVGITKAGQLGEFLRAGNRGSRIFIFDGLVNVAGATVRALDVNVDYRSPLGGGTFEFSTTGTFFIDYRFQALPTEPYYEYAGHATVGGTGSEGTVPGYRFYTTSSFEKNNWGVFVGHTYIPSVTDIGPGGQAFVTSTSLTRQKVDAYQAWDLQLTYRFADYNARRFSWVRGLKVTLGVNNLFDELAPQAKQAFVEAYADVSTYGAIGRLVYASAGWKF
jgi:iron complex outermembrane receptor protein